jgi:hypothetical protein
MSSTAFHCYIINLHYLNITLIGKDVYEYKSLQHESKSGREFCPEHQFVCVQKAPDISQNSSLCNEHMYHVSMQILTHTHEELRKHMLKDLREKQQCSV